MAPATAIPSSTKNTTASHEGLDIENPQTFVQVQVQVTYLLCFVQAEGHANRHYDSIDRL